MRGLLQKLFLLPPASLQMVYKINTYNSKPNRDNRMFYSEEIVFLFTTKSRQPTALSFPVREHNGVYPYLVRGGRLLFCLVPMLEQEIAKHTINNVFGNIKIDSLFTVFS